MIKTSEGAFDRCDAVETVERSTPTRALGAAAALCPKATSGGRGGEPVEF